jgi:hypothetical protein
MLVNQLAHQFGDADGGMRVVQLDAKHLVETVKRQSLAQASAYHVLDCVFHAI